MCSGSVAGLSARADDQADADWISIFDVLRMPGKIHSDSSLSPAGCYGCANVEGAVMERMEKTPDDIAQVMAERLDGPFQTCAKQA